MLKYINKLLFKKFIFFIINTKNTKINKNEFKILL